MNGQQDTEEMQRIDKMKKEILRKIMTKEAIERVARLRLVKPELSAQLELYLMQLYQAGKIGKQINDEQIKIILDSLTTKREFKIIR
jgi:programmed cell death protein 5